MFKDATSGLNSAAGFTRSSTRLYGPPPVVMLMAASVLALIRGRKGRNASGVWSGCPVSGSRACRCRMEAPASAAAIAWSAISSGVIGRYSDIDGVWIAPVTAQVMITLFCRAMSSCLPTAAALNEQSFNSCRQGLSRRRGRRRVDEGVHGHLDHGGTVRRDRRAVDVLADEVVDERRLELPDELGVDLALGSDH